MKKKLLPSIAGMLTAFCMLFPAVPVHGEDVAIPENSAPVTMYYPSTNRYCYDQLSEDGKELYQKLLTACLEVENSSGEYKYTPYVERSSNVSDEELSDIVSIFSYDHPEFFWLDRTFGKYKQVYVMMDVQEKFQTGEARDTTRSQMKNVLSQYITSAMERKQTYQRAYFLAARLKNDTSYGEGGDKSYSKSMASALVGTRQTVCAGYTKAYSYLCNAVGIDVISMTSVNHAWNLIQLDGNWYYTDITNQFYFMSRPQILNTQFARTTQSQSRRYPAQANGILSDYVRDENGNIKLYGVYDNCYYVYDNIFPDCNVSYYDSISTNDDRTGQTKWIFRTENADTHYYLSDSQEAVTVNDLVSDFEIVNEFENGDIISSDTLSTERFQIQEGWRTPEEIYSHHEEGENYYHGGIPCKFGDVEFMLGDVWVGTDGDCDLDGMPTASDAASILIYSAAVGAGEENVSLSENPEISEEFVKFLTNHDSDTLNADTASRILILAAVNGAGG